MPRRDRMDSAVIRMRFKMHLEVFLRQGHGVQ